MEMYNKSKICYSSIRQYHESVNDHANNKFETSDCLIDRKTLNEDLQFICTYTNYTNYISVHKFR